MGAIYFGDNVVLQVEEGVVGGIGLVPMSQHMAVDRYNSMTGFTKRSGSQPRVKFAIKDPIETVTVRGLCGLAWLVTLLITVIKRC